MGMEYLVIVTFPPLGDVYKLLAVVVALYFPVAMLTWLAIDKLQNASEDSANVLPPKPRPFRFVIRTHRRPLMRAQAEATFI